METVGGWAHQNGDQKDFDIYDVDHDYHDYHDHDFTNFETKKVGHTEC